MRRGFKALLDFSKDVIISESRVAFIVVALTIRSFTDRIDHETVKLLLDSLAPRLDVIFSTAFAIVFFQNAPIGNISFAAAALYARSGPRRAITHVF